ncbi:MAG: hypothetical protein CMH98_11220 [Oceanospirillaceae bacterium]|nr:hypothetical protein [Oceanospirillaceae bacterium]
MSGFGGMTAAQFRSSHTTADGGAGAFGSISAKQYQEQLKGQSQPGAGKTGARRKKAGGGKAKTLTMIEKARRAGISVHRMHLISDSKGAVSRYDADFYTKARDYFRSSTVGKKDLEHYEQCLVCDWVYTKHPDVYPHFKAVPNGGGRTAREGNKLQAEGTQAGEPDLNLSIPCGPYHGLYIEMKKPWSAYTKTGKEDSIAASKQLQDHQALRLRQLHEQGYMAAVCYGADEAIKVIADYLALGAFDAGADSLPGRQRDEYWKSLNG